MTAEQFANNAQTTLASALGNNLTDTSLVVADASSFPATVPFRIRIGGELLLVTALSGTGNTTWTVERAIESTAIAAYAAGTMVVQVLTAALMEELAALVADQSANQVLAGPASGSATGPTFRALTLSDLPTSVSGAIVPTGMISAFAGSSAPTGWLACDGSAVSRTTYANLFSAISTTWGSGDGSTTFNLPNFTRRVAVGSGGTATSTLGNAVGNTGGEEAHTLVTSEMPSHTHAVATGFIPITGTGDFYAGFTGPTSEDTTTHAGRTSYATGGGDAHNNIQPSAVVLYCVKT